MKFKKVFGLTSLSLVAISLLAGCGKTYDESDIVSIEINEDTFNDNWTFVLNQTVNYTSISVDLLDDRKEVLDTVDYNDSPSSFEYTEIDTSILGDGVFTVIYTSSLGESFSDSKEYTVVETVDYEPTSWGENVQYTLYKSEVNNALDQNEDYLDEDCDLDFTDINDTDLSSTSLIKSDGKFYVANHNAVDLAPERYYYVPGSGSALLITSAMPSTTSIAIYAQSDEDWENNLVDKYFENDDYTTACTTGYVDFIDDLTGLERDITIVFSATDGVFDDQAIDLTLVDGWNITEADQLVLFDNAKSSANYYKYPDHVIESYLEKKKEVLGKDDVTSTTSFETFVLFNNITIELEDLPSGVLWSSEDALSTNYLNGSLKDWYLIYEHNNGTAWGNAESTEFNFYGNYNSIILGETFPYVLSERSDVKNQSGSAENLSKIDTHTSLFGSTDAQDFADADEYEINFYDFSAVGNQGVAANQKVDINDTPDDEQDDVTAGGILFAKFRANVNFSNCTVTNYFTVFLTNGEGNTSDISNEYQLKYTIDYCKFNNSYNCLVYSYGECNIYVTNSLLSESGGPLFLLAGVPFGDSSFSNYEDQKQGTNLTIDEATVLKNYVTGEGGWFDLNDAKPYVNNIKTIGELFKETYKKDFVTDRGDGVDALNLIAVSMSTETSSASALRPGMDVNFKIGNKTYIDYYDGKDTLDKIVKANVNEFASNLSTALNTLANSVYGTQFLYKLLGSNAAGSLPTFVTYDSEGLPVFTTVDSDTTEIISVASYVNTLLKSVGMDSYATLPETVPSNLLDGSKYISLYAASGGTSGASFSGSSVIEQIQNAYNSYEGSTAYGIVLELFDVTN